VAKVPKTSGPSGEMIANQAMAAAACYLLLVACCLPVETEQVDLKSF
jgi:hypothetical protein